MKPWTIAILEGLTPAEESLFWDEFEQSLEEDDGVVAGHLAAGRAVYYREKTTPPGVVVKLYPNGAIEWVVPASTANDAEQVVRVLHSSELKVP